MKKKITLVTLVFVLYGINGFSQILQNTTWEVNDSSGSLISYFRFDTDTLLNSINNVTYSNLSVYEENGNDFSLVDLITSGGCLLTDTGRYTFLIQNDTLKFTLVSDLCAGRSQVIPIFHWVRIITGIDKVNLMTKLNVYPNPGNGIFTFSFPGLKRINVLLIFDISGRKLKEVYEISDSYQIDMTGFSPGIYFYKAKSEDGFYEGKVLVN